MDLSLCFFLNDPATSEIKTYRHTLSLHDALPISDATPLPHPVPFHSDADEFPDEAFEEATKVRSVEELVAQTAKGNEVEAKASRAAEEAAADKEIGRAHV